MPWPQTGATQYYAQLGLSDKVRAIKGLVVCYVVWLGSMKGLVLGIAQGAWVGQDGYRAQVPKPPI